MNDNRHEELARRLLEDPPSTWPDELGALRVEMRSMPASLRARLNELAESPAPPVSREGIAPRSKVIRLRLAAAAGIGTALAAGIFLYFGPMLHRPGMENLRATIVFVEGDARRGDSPVQAGAPLMQGEDLSLGTNSMAVVVAQQDRTEAKLRIRPESIIHVDALRPDLFQARIKRGVVLASLSHGDSPKPGSPGLSIVTSTGEATAVGTLFSVDLKGSGDTTLSTFEGTVTFRRRWDALEDLPENLIKENEVLSATRNILRKASTGVGAGSQSSITQQDFQARLTVIARLNQVLAQPSVARVRNRPNPTEAEIRDALRYLEQAFPSPEERAAILSLAEKAFGQPPEVQPIPSDEVQTRRDSLEALSEAEREARYRELRTGERPMDRDTFRREATRALGKAPQEIKLKNGEMIYGTIFGEQGRYRVYTAEGIRIVAPDEIEEILFQ